jgi:cytochrome o ubiquinol oxidase subunit 2
VKRCRSVAVLAAAVILGGCSQGVLVPAGPVSEAERTILFDSLAIMLAIVIPVIIATLAVAWWFRASNTRAAYLPDFNYSGRLELLVWSIPALVVLFLGGIAWIGAHDLDPGKPMPSAAKPLDVEVVALDWKWLFIYPQQGIASVNRLVVPAGVPVRFRITSASVFNIFWVPRLGSEIYAMNGMVTKLNLEADHPGNFPGLSAHFSGDGFSDMHFDAVAVPADQFATWVKASRENGNVLDEAAYRQLLRQSQNVQPFTYRGVQNGLFDAVATQMLPPGEGPTEGRGGTAINPEH